MGIYDRDYYKDDRGRGGGGSPGHRIGGIRMLSVTAWLIIINSGIFLVQSGMGGLGVPVLVSMRFVEGVTDAQVANSKPVGGFVTPDARGVFVPADPALEKRVGVELHTTLAEVRPDGTAVPTGRAAYAVMDPLRAYGHFSTATGFLALEVWRLVTFQFLHGSFMHLFFNMFALWMFGPLVEEQLGRKRYLAFYLACGIFGGLMYLLLNLLGVLRVPLPGVLRVEVYTPLVGASAGVFGVLMACAYIAPRAPLQFILLPITIRMKWFVYGYFVVAMWNLISAGHNQGGDAAHVGGALAGYFFIRRPHLLRDFFDIFGDSRKTPEARRPRSSPGSDGEIDAILDKISREGMTSLSAGEKRRLEEHSRQERSR